METMLVNGAEHAIQVYDDDCGFGLTLCNHTIGPQDVGPRLDEKLDCPLCKDIIAKNPVEHNIAFISKGRGEEILNTLAEARGISRAQLDEELIKAANKPD